MSLNACNINCSPIDSICDNRRAVTIEWLQSLLPVDPVQPTVVGKGRAKPSTPRIQAPVLRRQEVDEPQEYQVIEHDNIAVTITINGVEFTQTKERNSLYNPLILVKIKAVNAVSDDISVNIRIKSIK